MTVDTGAAVGGEGFIEGDLAFNGGSLDVVLTSATTANAIDVTGSVSGTGVIDVDNGAFSPMMGDTLTVLTAGSYAGEMLTANNGWTYIGSGQIQFGGAPALVGDFDMDNDVDLDDFTLFGDRFGAPVVMGEEIYDLVVDGTIDLSDFAEFVAVYPQ